MEVNNLELLFRLLFSHLLVDFVLQSNSLVQKKREKRPAYHLLHSMAQAISAYIFAGEWGYWEILPIIFGTHLMIDYWKISRRNKLQAFVVDQFLHFAVIGITWLYLTGQFTLVGEVIYPLLKCTRCWAVLIGYLLILKPSSIFLGLFTQRWRTEGGALDSLQNAGQWIGYLERILIVTFILIGRIEAIGFLLAAKSIFRFGELSKTKEIKTTEYVLIGTFASFTISVLIGLILTKVLG